MRENSASTSRASQCAEPSSPNTSPQPPQRAARPIHSPYAMEPVPATRLMPSAPAREPAQLQTMSLPMVLRGTTPSSSASKAGSNALSSPCAGRPAKVWATSPAGMPACCSTACTPSRSSVRSASKPISR
jgi:hypothetical protein